jgi:DNA-binding transcriptional ArsR family regulator
MSRRKPSNIMQPIKEEHAERSPEIDQFVDHFLSLMCDRSRRQILELLAVPIDGQEGMQPSFRERRSTDIARELGLSPATTSEHLHQLCDAKLIAARRDRNAVFYRLSNEMLVRAFRDLVLALNKEHASRSANHAN